MLGLAIPLDFVTAYFAQAKEAATKLLDTELDKSMKKFEAENRDFFGEYTNARMIPSVLHDEDEGVAEALRRDAELAANPSASISPEQLDQQMRAGRS